MKRLIEIQLFPPIDYFKKLAKFKELKIEKFEHYQKMSFRNRYVIAGANAITHLTIPIKGGREQKTVITKVLIDDSKDWRKQHWRSITSAYSKAPFFDYYSFEIKNMLDNQEKALFDFNIFILSKLIKMMNINAKLDFTIEYRKQNEEDLDYRNVILPKSFQQEGEKWKPKYAQVFEDRIGFQPNLSILDLLFCEGPNAGTLIMASVSN